MLIARHPRGVIDHDATPPKSDLPLPDTPETIVDDVPQIVDADYAAVLADKAIAANNIADPLAEFATDKATTLTELPDWIAAVAEDVATVRTALPDTLTADVSQFSRGNKGDGTLL